MNETFRISERHVKRQKLIYVQMLVVVVAILIAQLWWNEHGVDPVAGGLFAVGALAITGFAFIRAYRHTKTFKTRHVLILTDEAILLREGEIEQRIPYGAIQSLKIRKPYFGGERHFLITCAGMSPIKFYGYESIERLLSALVAKLPRDRVRGNDARA